MQMLQCLLLTVFMVLLLIVVRLDTYKRNRSIRMDRMSRKVNVAPQKIRLSRLVVEEYHYSFN